MKPLLYSVLPRPPHPTRDGLAIRNYHLLAALSDQFRVRAFGMLDPERAYGGGEMPRGLEVEWIPQARRGVRRIGAAAASLLAGGPYSARLYRSERLKRRVAAEAAAEKPRWIVAHSYHVGTAALDAGAPVWIDFHNLDSEIWRRTAAHASSAFVRWFAATQAPRVARFERTLASRAAGLSCVSRKDADGLRGLGAAVEPLVVPNGVDVSRYVMRRDAAEEEIVFFVGDLSWSPNADAVRWFRSRIWPDLRRMRPLARVEILGRGAPPDLARASTPDFRLLGEGADTRPLWARAAVSVVPLSTGGGTRLKILESAASGVPVVSTPVGAEGLEFVPEREIRLREEPEHFARAVAELLADRSLARAQAAAARARVEALYDWERIGQEFARELAQRAAERP